MSESNRTQLRYVVEAAYGVTPVNSTGWKPIPFNSESLNVGPATTQSQRIRGSDRMPADLKKVNTNVGGQIGLELSATDFEDFIQGALMAAPRATITATTIDAADADDSFNDSGSGFVTAGFAPGDVFITVGFTTAANNGTWTIDTVVAGKIVVLETGVMVTEAAGDSVTLSTQEGWSEKANTGVIAQSVDAASNEFRDAANGYITAGFEVGDVFTSTDFTNGANNGTWTVAAIVAGAITVAETGILVTEVAGADEVLATGNNHATAGLNSYCNQFTFEKEFADLTNKFIQAKGCRVGQFDMAFVINEIVTGSMVVAGATGLLGAASLVGAGSEAAASGNDVLAGNVDTDFVLYDGVDIATSGIIITRVDLSINNTLRPNYSLTSDSPIDQKAGTHRFTGTIEAYVSDESWEIYQDMFNNTEVSLKVKVTGTDGKGYILDLPKIKVSGDAPSASGLDQDNMIRAEFLAIESVPSISRIN
jgi:hypothetical protein